jgi:hypothetical protein
MEPQTNKDKHEFSEPREGKNRFVEAAQKATLPGAYVKNREDFRS